MQPLPPFVVGDEDRLEVQLRHYQGLHSVGHRVQLEEDNMMMRLYLVVMLQLQDLRMSEIVIHLKCKREYLNH